MGDMEFDKFVRPLENSLASKFSHTQFQTWNLTIDILVWKKSQQAKKNEAAKKKAEAAANKTDEPEVVDLEADQDKENATTENDKEVEETSW